MNRVLPLACLLLPLSLMLPTRPDTAFVKSEPKLGARINLTSKQQLDLEVSVRMAGKDMGKMNASAKSDITCGVTTAAPAALKLEFGKCTEVTPNPLGQPAPVDSAYCDKTYSATLADDGTATVTAPKEGLDKTETEMVGYVCSMARAPLAGLLAGKSVKPGEKLEVPVATAQQVIAILAQDAKVESLELVLDGERKEGTVECGVFKVKAKLASLPSEENPAKMTMELTGEFLVAKAGCLLVAASLTGPVVLSGNADQGGLQMQMEGKGTVTWTGTTRGSDSSGQ